MYYPKCNTCEGEGELAASECPDCHGTGELDHWIERSHDDYWAAIKNAGGLEELTVLAGYTCCDGDVFTRGRRIETTWGKRDGTPVCYRGQFNDDPRADQLTDMRAYYVWEPPAP